MGPLMGGSLTDMERDAKPLMPSVATITVRSREGVVWSKPCRSWRLAAGRMECVDLSGVETTHWLGMGCEVSVSLDGRESADTVTDLGEGYWEMTPRHGVWTWLEELGVRIMLDYRDGALVLRWKRLPPGPQVCDPGHDVHVTPHHGGGCPLR